MTEPRAEYAVEPGSAAYPWEVRDASGVLVAACRTKEQAALVHEALSAQARIAELEALLRDVREWVLALGECGLTSDGLWCATHWERVPCPVGKALELLEVMA